MTNTAKPTQVPTITLNDGTSIPQLGFGVFLVEPGETERIVTDALEAGYRHIDTAKIYGNEEGVGRAIAKSGIPRDELYITTKLWNDDQGRENVRPALEASLERLALDHVDLYLIHWPTPERGLYVETWEAMLELPATGLTTSVGVCNFLEPHLRDIISATGTAPVVNQIEQHPYLQQPELDAVLTEHDIRIEAWGPLAQAKTGLFDEPAVIDAARAHNKSPAQAIIRWHLQKGNIVFPKTVSRARMDENFSVLDFELTDDEFAAISLLDKGEEGRVATNPNDFN
ncbi:2,5-diketo-D-gluconic acid reductase [Pseudoclavibacter endophyticus]|uniref:Aldo/keto reductase n=1 Tax=Pseudoclavibacter endophyticus TaxID=1778590 RepID=A0A6H9WPB5_9MICO|nr:aldo/keto reductase [Pseudoclavibacter endophyticus]KAB1649571.1 aldo/keto reductase [Pseudoclavibacter endophyticus]GGA61527.1 2,5-diketo-D-gluconic acid reductase [Pseudoclavibacter endophyticus]